MNLQVRPPYMVCIVLDELVMTQADESFFWHMKHSPQALCGRGRWSEWSGREGHGVAVHIESGNYA